MSDEIMSAVDAAWYQMDAPGNAADITVLLIFDGILTLEGVKDLLEARLLSKYPRFKKRVERRSGKLFWVAEDAFDIDAHVSLVELESGDQAALESFVGRVTTPPIVPDKPLWNLSVIHGLDKGSALLIRIHHCIGDGFGLAAAFLRLTDEAGAEVQDIGVQVEDRLDEDFLHHGFKEMLVQEFEQVLEDPKHALEIAEHAADAMKSLGHLTLLPFDAHTRLKGELSGERRVSWTPNLDLGRIKAIGKSMDATINDVLLTALTGAMRRLLLEWEDEVNNHQIRAVVPVNLRPVSSIDEMDGDLGNRFGLVFLDLPTDKHDPHERLAKLKASMDELKRSPEALVAFGILNALGKTPAVIEHLIGEVFTKKASIVVTNVPGPRRELRLNNNRLSDIVFWVPHPVQLGVGVSIISYNGNIRVGVRSDAAILADPTILTGFFLLELDRPEVIESA